MTAYQPAEISRRNRKSAQVQNQISRWENTYLNSDGQYIGLDFRAVLKGSDWMYAPGEYVPLDERYSAMISWEWHQKALEEKGRGI